MQVSPKNSAILDKMVVYSTLFPYFQPIPFPTDVQPLPFIFAILGVLLQISNNSFKPIYNPILLLIPISVLSFFISPILYGVEIFGLFQKSITPVLLLALTIALRQSLVKFTVKDITIVTLIYLAAGIIEIFFRDLYVSVIPTFVNYKEMSFGLRGIRSIAPEPTDLGLVMFCLATIFEIKAIEERTSFIRIFIIRASIILILLASISTLSYLCLIIYLIYITPNKLKIIYITAPVLLYYFLPGALEVRAIDIIFGLITNPMEIVSNTSLFYRYIDTFAAVYYLNETLLLPTLHGSSTLAYPYLVSNSDILGQFPNRTEFLLRMQLHPPEAFRNVISSLLIDYGVFGIAWLASMIWAIFRRVALPFLFLVLAAFLIYVGQSFPLAFPPIFALIGVALTNRQRKAFHVER